MKVENVYIKVRNGPRFDVREDAIKKGYTKVLVSKDCTEIMITGTGSKNEQEVPNGELFFPLINIFQIAVDWIPGTKRQG